MTTDQSPVDSTAELDPAEHDLAEDEPAEDEPAELDRAEHHLAEDEPAELDRAEHHLAEDEPAEDEPAEGDLAEHSEDPDHSEEPGHSEEHTDDDAEESEVESTVDRAPSGGVVDVTRRWFRVRPATLILAGVAGFLAWCVYGAPYLLYFLYVFVSLLLAAIATTTLIWMVHAWRTPDSVAEGRFADDGRQPVHSISLIVPARHEEAVLERTLEHLVTTDHPDFEVVVVVGDDDAPTRLVAERTATLHPDRIKVVVDDSRPKNKPKALNAALSSCRGDLIGVFDAEDDVHPALLRRVDQCFQETQADIVQAGVQLMNFHSSWLTVHNVLEYYFWFRSRLHLHARQRFVPLGGNTVFVRAELLRAVHGWDPDCLAEDCELGVRLSSLGARTEVFYEPDLVTREECPPTLPAFLRQRTRWNQGYLQTLSKGCWHQLPFWQRTLGAYILSVPYALAVAWILIPVAIVTAWISKFPVPITLISFLPVLPILCLLVVETAGLGEFCRQFSERATFRDYLRLVVGLPLYQAVLAFAAARAAVRERRGARNWEKTTHLGLHLEAPTREASTREESFGEEFLGGETSEEVSFGEEFVGGDSSGETTVEASVREEPTDEEPVGEELVGEKPVGEELVGETTVEEFVGEEADLEESTALASVAEAPTETVAESEEASEPTGARPVRDAVMAVFKPRADRASASTSLSLRQGAKSAPAPNGPNSNGAPPRGDENVETHTGVGPEASGNGNADLRSDPDPFRESGTGPLWVRLNGASAPTTEATAVPGPDPADGSTAPTTEAISVPGPAPLDGSSAPTTEPMSVPSLALVEADAPPSQPLRQRRGILRRLKSVDVAVQVPLLIGVGLVQFTNAIHWPGVLFDEGTYVGNAWAVGNRGELAFYTYTYGHPPLGWLFVSLWTSIGGLFGHGTYSLDSSRELMCVIALVSCSLLYTLARRIKLTPFFAAGAVVLFALSPLSLFFHRGTLLDNPATAWAIAAFVLARSPQRRLGAFVASGACFAASVLSKETTLVIFPALLLAAYQNTDPRTRRYCMGLFCSSFLLIVFAFPLYAILKGELVPGPGHVSLLSAVLTQGFTRQGTGNPFDPRSVAHGTVTFWLSLDPWLIGAAMLFSPIALAWRNSRAFALAFLIQVLVIVRPGYLPAMYVIALLPFAALVVASSLQVLWKFTRGPHPRPVRLASEPAWRRAVSRAQTLLTPVAVAVSALILAASAVVAGLYVAPRWTSADRAAMTLKLDGPELATESWLLQHVGHEQRIIVTDDIWIFLIEHGYDSHPVRGGFNSPTVVSYWPLNKDPAVTRFFPDGWREFDYIVSNAAMRVTDQTLPSTEAALAHSRVVASFGDGDQRMDIRAITPTPVAGGVPPNTRAYVVPTSGAIPSLNEVALALRVNVDDLVSTTNHYPDAPAWWYYEGRHHYGSDLPRGTVLHYTGG